MLRMDRSYTSDDRNKRVEEIMHEVNNLIKKLLDSTLVSRFLLAFFI